MKRKISKIITFILLVIFIPIIVFYVAVYSWIGFIKLSVFLSSDKIYSNKYDKKLAQSIEFALIPDYDAYYSPLKVSSKNVQNIEFNYQFNKIKYFCIEVSEYSMETNELFKKLGLSEKYSKVIGYKKFLSGGESGSLLLIIKDNNDYIPITSNFSLIDYDTNLKFNEDFQKPHCAQVSDLHIQIKNEMGKKPHILFK